VLFFSAVKIIKITALENAALGANKNEEETTGERLARPSRLMLLFSFIKNQINATVGKHLHKSVAKLQPLCSTRLKDTTIRNKSSRLNCCPVYQKANHTKTAQTDIGF